MEPLKYDAVIDLSIENNSHSMVVNLVGHGKRVLDVGCASGYLAAALREQGCTVVGLEPDQSAAERAQAHVDRLLVGTVESIDLVAELGAQSQDVIVFADVLEHVMDPLQTLRAVLPLLSPDGCIVMSIPNVAHGSVRLALLQGRFEYAETGLLDATHIRWFTHSSLLAMVDEAGLSPVTLLRTVKDPFASEVAVSTADFDAATVEAMLDDPEATTYQFVLSVVPRERVPAGAAEVLAATEQARLSAHWASRAGAATPGVGSPDLPTGPRVGIAGSFGPRELGHAVRARVLEAELHRRLPGARLRILSSEVAGPVPTLGDLAVEPLAPAGEGGARWLKDNLDVLVGLDADGPASSQWWGEDDLSGAPLRVVWEDGRPDLLALASRLVSPSLAAHRVEVMRLLGVLAPESGRPLVVVDRSGGSADGGPLDPDLLDSEAEVVVLRGEGDVAGDPAAGPRGVTTLRLDQSLALEDVLAVIATAELVLSASSDVRALADSFGTPAATEEEQREGAPAHRPEAAAHGLDGHLDGVAGLLRGAGRGEPVDDLAGRVVALEEAHRRLRERTSRTHRALAQVMGDRGTDRPDGSHPLLLKRVQELSAEREALLHQRVDLLRAGASAERERENLHERLQAAQEEAARLRAELDFVNNGRTVRASRRAHLAYAALRRRAGA